MMHLTNVKYICLRILCLTSQNFIFLLTVTVLTNSHGFLDLEGSTENANFTQEGWG